MEIASYNSFLVSNICLAEYALLSPNYETSTIRVINSDRQPHDQIRELTFKSEVGALDTVLTILRNLEVLQVVFGSLGLLLRRDATEYQSVRAAGVSDRQIVHHRSCC